MCFETFDWKQPEKYIGKICLFKENNWQRDYTEIKVINVSHGFVKFKYCNGGIVTITDIDYFQGKRFVISPFQRTDESDDKQFTYTTESLVLNN